MLEGVANIEEESKTGFFSKIRKFANDVYNYTCFLKKEGPLYSWEAPNRKGELTIFYKFRTISSESAGTRDDSKETLDALGKPNLAPFNNFAGIMRRNNFDEIPQLWNLLKGDIGIVGTRPRTDKLIQESFVDYPSEKYHGGNFHARLIKRFGPNLCNVNYATDNADFENLRDNEYIYLLRKRACNMKHGSTLKVDAPAFFQIWYRRFFKGKKSE